MGALEAAPLLGPELRGRFQSALALERFKQETMDAMTFGASKSV